MYWFINWLNYKHNFIVVTSNINSIEISASLPHEQQPRCSAWGHALLWPEKWSPHRSCTRTQTHPGWWWWRCWVWRMWAWVLLSTLALGCYAAWLVAQWFPPGECAAPSHTAVPAAIVCCESRPGPRSLDRPEGKTQRERKEEKSSFPQVWDMPERCKGVYLTAIEANFQP